MALKKKVSSNEVITSLYHYINFEIVFAIIYALVSVL